MKILIVDDSSTIRLMIVKMLRELGHTELTAVSSAEEAIPLAFNSQFDLIITDWNLPKMSGFDFLFQLRNTPETQKVPIIMVTSKQDRGSILKALKAGVQGYIIKPISKDVLAIKISEIEQKSAVNS